MLNYIALGLLFFVTIVLFYGIIAIHDIPYDIAKHRNHPHQDAIHVAGWISLFTLHLIWPFLWIWATLYKPGLGWGMMPAQHEAQNTAQKLAEEIKTIEQRLALLEQAQGDQ